MSDPVTALARKWCPLHCNPVTGSSLLRCECDRLTAAIREALRCVHCGDQSEPRSQTRAICEDCFQTHMAQGKKNERREALEEAEEIVRGLACSCGAPIGLTYFAGKIAALREGRDA